MNNTISKILMILIASFNVGMIFTAPSFGQLDSHAVTQTSVNQAPPGSTHQASIPAETLENEIVAKELAEQVAAEDDGGYTLGAEDVINVTVLRHPEVSGDYLINKNGKMQYEFVGDISVLGMTKDEVAKTLAEKLSKYIIAPEVTVKIIGYNSKVVYVIGEVGNPGKIYMRGDTITIREALIQAGLPLLSAKLTKTMLITPSSDGSPRKSMVDLNKLLYKGDLRENFEMNPGDTLYVPPTFFAKALRVIQPVAAPIGTAAGTGRTVTGTGF